jgi:O-antigen/teichoic acid export membrane protein
VSGPVDDDILASRRAGRVAVRGGAIRAGGYVLGTLLSLISVPILIRHLGIEEFGRYSVVITVIGIVAGLTEGGINLIAVREYAASGAERRDRVMRHLLGIRLVTTTAGVGLGVCFMLAGGYSSVLVAGTALAGLGLLLSSLQALLGSSLHATLRFGWVTGLELARQALTAVLIVALALGGASLLPFFVVPIAAGALTLVLTVPLVRRLMPLRPAFDLTAWRALLRDVLPWAIATALSTTYFRIALVITSLIATDRVTGYYATSFRVIEVLIMVPGTAIAAAMPILSRAAVADSERFDAAARRIVELAVIGGAGLAALTVLGAPVAIDVLAGPQGAPSIDVLRLHGAAMLPTFIASAAGVQLLSMNRAWSVVAGNVAGLAAAVGLTFALVPVMDASGAALATVVAELVVASALLVALARVRPVIAAGLRTAAPAVLLAAAVAAIALLPLPALVQLVLGGLAFTGGLVAIGRFPPEVREALGR